MVRKRKTAKGRLREEIERAGRRPDLRRVLRDYREPDWSDERVRQRGANAALTLSDSPGEAALRTAFKRFGLDPIDPWNWRDLLIHLARILFSPTGPRGAGPKWDEHRRLQFEFDVVWARNQVTQIFGRRGEPPPTDDDIASYLIFKRPQRYGAVQQGTLRKYISSGPPKGRRKAEK